MVFDGLAFDPGCGRPVAAPTGLMGAFFRSCGARTAIFPKEIYHSSEASISSAGQISYPQDISFFSLGLL